MGVVEYALRISGSPDARIESYIGGNEGRSRTGGRNLGESALFDSPDGSGRLKNDAATERAIADHILALEGSGTATIRSGSGVGVRETLVSPNAIVGQVQDVITAHYEAQKSGDQARIDATQREIQKLADTGMFATRAKTPQEIKAQAIERARRVAGTVKVTPQQINDSMGHIADQEIVNKHGMAMSPTDKPIFLSASDRAKRDAQAWRGIHDALEPLASQNASEGMTIVTSKDGERHLFGAGFNAAQLKAILALNPAVVPTSIKRLIVDLNPRVKDGESISLTYYSKIYKKGNIPKSYRNGTVTSFLISKAGNVAIKFFDRTLFDKTLMREAIEHPDGKIFAPFKEVGDEGIQPAIDRFQQAVLKYTDNHKNGLPGNTDLHTDPARAMKMKDAINGFMGISDETVNALASDNNFYRTLRLDGMFDVTPGRNEPMPIAYNPMGRRYQEYNFMPNVGEQSPEQRALNERLIKSGLVQPLQGTESVPQPGTPSPLSGVAAPASGRISPLLALEAVPGAKTGILSGIQTAPFKAKVPLTRAVINAVRAGLTTDPLSAALGLKPVYPEQMASGAYAGEVNPMIPIHFEDAERNPDGSLTEGYKRKMDILSAGLGKALVQQMVGYTHPVPVGVEARPNAMSVVIDGGRGLTPREAVQVDKLLSESLGADGYAMISDKAGVRFLNFTDKPPEQFELAVQAALRYGSNARRISDAVRWRNDANLPAQAGVAGEKYDQIIAQKIKETFPLDRGDRRAPGPSDIQTAVDLLQQRARPVITAERIARGQPEKDWGGIRYQPAERGESAIVRPGASQAEREGLTGFPRVRKVHTAAVDRAKTYGVLAGVLRDALKSAQAEGPIATSKDAENAFRLAAIRLGIPWNLDKNFRLVDPVSSYSDVWSAANDASKSGENISLKPEEATAPILYMPAEPVFKSNILSSLDTLPEKMGADELRARLLKIPGAKKEADWIGIDDLLAGKKSVTRQEVKDFVEANQVQVKEVVLDDQESFGKLINYDTEHDYLPPPRGSGLMEDESFPVVYFRYSDGKTDIGAVVDWSDHDVAQGKFQAKDMDGGSTWHDTKDEAESALANKIKGHVEDATLFNRPDLLTPGEKPGTYRELVLSLPVAPKVPMTFSEFLQNRGISNNEFISGTVEQRDLLRRVYKEHLDADTLGASRNVADQKEFRSSHYPNIPNPIAHIRFNERTGPNGERILFIEEKQSDWDLGGRKHGYKERFSDQKPYVVKSLDQELNRFSTEQEAQDWAYEHRKKTNDINIRIDHEAGAGSVADNPFRGEWTKLAVKRMLRYAADNGFDKIAWTTGDMQIDRYDLSKQVSSITANKNGDGTFELFYTQPGNRGSNPLAEKAKPESLSGIVGKDLAEKIASQTEEGKTYEGLDLRVGGEGKKVLYDKIIPQEFDKIGKKFGARVGSMPLADAYVKKGGLGDWIIKRQGKPDAIVGSTYGKTPQEVLLNWHEGDISKIPSVHSIDVTPAMREGIAGKSQMQFMPAERDAAYLKAVESGDMEAAQKMVDEAAKVEGYATPAVHSTWTGDEESAFNEFKKQKTPSLKTAIRNWGFFFSPRKFAGGMIQGLYANMAGGKKSGGEPRHINANLKIENPKTVTSTEFSDMMDFGSLPNQKHNNLTSATRAADAFKAEAIAQGHDGFLILDPSGDVAEIVAIDPSQIKSADPITRDDAGKVIPLSKRFNQQSDDIRFMPADKVAHEQTVSMRPFLDDQPAPDIRFMPVSAGKARMLGIEDDKPGIYLAERYPVFSSGVSTPQQFKDKLNLELAGLKNELLAPSGKYHTQEIDKARMKAQAQDLLQNGNPGPDARNSAHRIANADEKELQYYADLYLGKIQEQQSQVFDQWVDYVTNGGYSTAEQYLLLHSMATEMAIRDAQGNVRITKLGGNSERISVAPSPAVAGRVMGMIQDGAEPKRLSQMWMEVSDAIEKESRAKRERFPAKTDTGIEGEWIKFPSKANDPKNFTKNVSDLEALAKTSADFGNRSWCTGEGQAHSQLSGGDFWIYTVDNKARVGIRMDGSDKIGEMSGILKGQYLEPQMAPVALKLVKEKEFIGGEDFITDAVLRQGLRSIEAELAGGKIDKPAAVDAAKKIIEDAKYDIHNKSALPYVTNEKGAIVVGDDGFEISQGEKILRARGRYHNEDILGLYPTLRDAINRPGEKETSDTLKVTDWKPFVILEPTDLSKASAGATSKTIGQSNFTTLDVKADANLHEIKRLHTLEIDSRTPVGQQPTVKAPALESVSVVTMAPGAKLDAPKLNKFSYIKSGDVWIFGGKRISNQGIKDIVATGNPIHSGVMKWKNPEPETDSLKSVLSHASTGGIYDVVSISEYDGIKVSMSTDGSRAIMLPYGGEHPSGTMLLKYEVEGEFIPVTIGQSFPSASLINLIHESREKTGDPLTLGALQKLPPEKQQEIIEKRQQGIVSTTYMKTDVTPQFLDALRAQSSINLKLGGKNDWSRGDHVERIPTRIGAEVSVSPVILEKLIISFQENGINDLEIKSTDPSDPIIIQSKSVKGAVALLMPIKNTVGGHFSIPDAPRPANADAILANIKIAPPERGSAISYMPSSESGEVAEPLPQMDNGSISKFTPDLAIRFMPSDRKVDLEDYADRQIIALPADRLGVGPMATGPQGNKKIMSVDAQGGRGFMNIFNGGGWSFSNEQTANRFLTRAKQVADKDGKALVAVTVLGGINHLNSPYGQLGFSNAIRAAIESGDISEKSADRHMRAILAKVKRSPKLEGNRSMAAVGDIKTFADYEKAVNDKSLNFQVAAEIVDRAQNVELPLSEETRSGAGIDIATIAKDLSDPELSDIPAGSVVALMEIDTRKSPTRDNFHYSYPVSIHGKRIGFLKDFPNIQDLTSSEKIYSGKASGNKILAPQPLQAVLPELDLLGKSKGLWIPSNPKNRLPLSRLEAPTKPTEKKTLAGVSR